MLQWGGKNKNDLVAECRSTTKIKTVITRASYGIHNCHTAADNMLWHMGSYPHSPSPRPVWSSVDQTHAISALIAKNTWNLIPPLMTTSNRSPRQVYLPVINNLKILCIYHFLSYPDCLPTFTLQQMFQIAGWFCDTVGAWQSWLVCTWFW